jgi:4-amino-4-deoxy-L-arabinose transferase and related glycosyltransferases of PMT family
MRKILKKLRPGAHQLILWGILLLAISLRLTLIALQWPIMNSDETNMGLLAKHIAFNGEWPIFFYGQPYMGPVEGYIAALIFRVQGYTSLFTLRLALLPFFVLFILTMYWLVSLLYSRKFALFTTLLFALGGSAILSLQLKAVGEYPETELFAAMICLITLWLALDKEKTARPALLRLCIYALLGLTIGIAIWVDMLILPFVGMSILLLLLMRRHEVLSRQGIILVIGLIIGLIPLIIYNLQAPLSQNSLVVLFSLQASGTPTPLLQHLIGVLGIALPSIMSFSPPFTQNDFPLLGQPQILGDSIQTCWGLGYLVLWVLAFLTSLNKIKGIWYTSYRVNNHKVTLDYEQQQQLVQASITVMILISAMATLLLFAKSTASSTAPSPTTRYLIGMIISIPSVLWPLWQRVTVFFSQSSISKKMVVPISNGIILLVILCIFTFGSIYTLVHEVPQGQQVVTAQSNIVQYLQKSHVQYFYTDYWTCNNIIFLSSENIQCGVLDNNNLTIGYNRYHAYLNKVRSIPDPAYVFALGSPQIKLLDQKLARHAFNGTYQRSVYDGKVYYIPQAGN